MDATQPPHAPPFYPAPAAAHAQDHHALCLAPRLRTRPLPIVADGPFPIYATGQSSANANAEAPMHEDAARPSSNALRLQLVGPPPLQSKSTRVLFGAMARELTSLPRSQSTDGAVPTTYASSGQGTEVKASFTHAADPY